MTGRDDVQPPTPLGPLPDDDPVAVALADALRREAQSVTPSPAGLDRIRSAIEQGATPRRRERLVPLVAAAASVAVVVGIAALTTLDRSQDRSTPPATSPSPTPSSQPSPAPTSQPSPTTPGPSPSPTASPQPSITAPDPSGLPVYYPGPVGESFGLFREFHPTAATDPAQRVQEAVTQALSRPPDDPDYVSVWAAGADARTSVEADLITITLNEAAAGGTSVAGTGPDAVAVQQLIWTATAATVVPGGPAGPTRVRIVAEGPTPDRFGSIDLSRPFTRGPQPGSAEPRAPVWITSIGEGARVRAGAITISGQGVGGPFALRWQLSRGETVLSEGSMTPTTEGGGPLEAGVRGVWSIILEVPDPGQYTVTVTEDVPPDAAGGTDSKDLTVT